MGERIRQRLETYYIAKSCFVETSTIDLVSSKMSFPFISLVLQMAVNYRKIPVKIVTAKGTVHPIASRGVWI